MCDNCIDGYYKNDILCLKCHKNCEKCSKGPENSNEKCESCLNKEWKLIKADGFQRNCVEKCPDNTTEKDNICVGKKSKSY